MQHTLFIMITLALVSRVSFLPVWLQECSKLADPPKFTLTATKSTILIGEDFEIMACLTNMMDDTLRIYDLEFDEGLLHFDAIIDPDSIIKITSGGNMCPPPSRDLAPGDETCNRINLTDYLGKTDKPSRYLHSINGKFKLIGVYRVDCVSDTIELEFVSPTGMDTIGLALVENLRNVYSLKEIHKYTDQIDDFVERNPNSVYSPMLLDIRDDAHNPYRKRENNDYLKTAKKLITSYPNSVRAVDSFHTILKSLSLKKRIKYLKDIATKYKGTRIGEFAETILKSKRSVYITNEKI